MYENITYAELKKLPREQKEEAWKELLSLNPRKKDLALKLGVSPALVYNMVSRYAGNKSARRSKADKTRGELASMVARTEKLEKSEAVEKADKKVADRAAIIDDSNYINSEETKMYTTTQVSTFSISIKKIVSGEDARFFLNGIGSTLLKDQKYCIEVKITEK